jgi:hypothetical protein
MTGSAAADRHLFDFSPDLRLGYAFLMFRVLEVLAHLSISGKFLGMGRDGQKLKISTFFNHHHNLYICVGINFCTRKKNGNDVETRNQVKHHSFIFL